MALLSVVRRWHYREHLSIPEIGRRTGLSQNTVRKYLRSDGVEPQVELFDRPSKLDPFADRLAAWLKTDANSPRKQKWTIKQLHADLVSPGFEGSCNRIAAFAREWRADRQREMQTTSRGTFCAIEFCAAYLPQRHEMLFDAHTHAFRVFGSIPQRGIYAVIGRCRDSRSGPATR